MAKGKSRRGMQDSSAFGAISLGKNEESNSKQPQHTASEYFVLHRRSWCTVSGCEDDCTVSL